MEPIHTSDSLDSLEPLFAPKNAVLLPERPSPIDSIPYELLADIMVLALAPQAEKWWLASPEEMLGFSSSSGTVRFKLDSVFE